MATAKAKILDEPVPMPAGFSSPLFKEAEKLLGIAEELNEKCERVDRQLYLSGFAFLSVLFAIFTVFVPFRESLFSPQVAFYFITGTVYGFALLAFMSRLIMGLVKRRKRDRRAFFEIVDMLRELEHSIMERENISQLERAAFHIRLSRFDIGPG